MGEQMIELNMIGRLLDAHENYYRFMVCERHLSHQFGNRILTVTAQRAEVDKYDWFNIVSVRF